MYNHISRVGERTTPARYDYQLTFPTYNPTSCILQPCFLGNIFELQQALTFTIATPITVDWKIFITKNFCWSPSTTKIKPTKYFLRRVNGVFLYCRVVIVTKIKLGENLTDEMFYQQKIPDLRYCMSVHYTSAQSEIGLCVYVYLLCVLVWLLSNC